MLMNPLYCSSLTLNLHFRWLSIDSDVVCMNPVTITKLFCLLNNYLKRRIHLFSYPFPLNVFHSKNVRFHYKVGQIRPNWDKSKTFSDQISVHFGSLSPRFEPFGANTSHLGDKPDIPALRPQ